MGKEAGDGVGKRKGPGTWDLEARIWHLDFILNVKGSGGLKQGRGLLGVIFLIPPAAMWKGCVGDKGEARRPGWKQLQMSRRVLMAAWTSVRAVNTGLDGQGWPEAQGSAFGFIFPSYTILPRAVGHWTFPSVAESPQHAGNLAFSSSWPPPCPALDPKPSSPRANPAPVTVLTSPSKPRLCQWPPQYTAPGKALRVWADRYRYIRGSLIAEKYPKTACQRAASFLRKFSSDPDCC